MKAKIDESLCCACGPCEDICPAVFQIVSNEGVAKVKVVPVAEEANCREAADNCPTEAITIEE